MTNKEKINSDINKIISKEEFLELNSESARQMSEDKNLNKQALEVLIKADEYRWIHQNSWMGEPLLNLPQDMFALQDIVWRTRPDYIVEVGVAWGGGMLFEASLLEIFGGKKVIGIDIFIPQDLKKRLNSHKKLSHRFQFIEGNSTSAETLLKLKNFLGNSEKILIILDSYHTHEHVLSELRAYSTFINKNMYIICADTIVGSIPIQTHRKRPWGPGNNPATAVAQFLKENDRFVIDKEIENRLLFSCHPCGYLKAIK